MDYEALWREVMAAPEDDGPRLVLADWFLERGDPRGELITTQCKPSYEDDLELRKRQHQLRSLVDPVWRADLGIPADDTIYYRRGLPDHITTKIRDGVLDVTDRAPITSIAFTRADGEPNTGMPAPRRVDDAAALVADPRLERIRAFATHTLPWGEVALTALLSSPRMAQLRRLDLAHHDCRSYAVTCALELPNLERLEFQGNDVFQTRLFPEDIARLCAANLPLRRLALESLALETPCGNYLADASWPHLEELVLSWNRLTSEDLKHVARSQSFPKLRTLTLNEMPIDDGLLHALAEDRGLPALDTLELFANRYVTARGLEALMTSPRFARMKRVFLGKATNRAELEPLAARDPRVVL